MNSAPAGFSPIGCKEKYIPDCAIFAFGKFSKPFSNSTDWLHANRINQFTGQDIQDYYEDWEPSNRFVVVAAVLFSAFSMAGVGLTKGMPSSP